MNQQPDAFADESFHEEHADRMGQADLRQLLLECVYEIDIPTDC